jgi:type I restriction-modification system DNA methylase subunit
MAEDFLTYQPGPVYDRIIANPPFGQQQDVTHVMHMLDCLKPRGILVSVMSAGVTFRGNRRVMELKARLQEETTWDVKELPEGPFKASGTNVNTVLLWAKKFEA